MSGKGNITVNGKALDEYFGEETLKVIVRQPLTVTDTLDKFDVICTVKGGGFSGQAGAIRHGIARALNEANLEYRPALKSNGFLTRDSRAKERKKYGLKKARKSSTILKEIKRAFIKINSTSEVSRLLGFLLLFGDFLL